MDDLWEGNPMNRELLTNNKPVFDQLHPAIYKAAIGLIAGSLRTVGFEAVSGW
jgi:hypothetical protein